MAGTPNPTARVGFGNGNLRTLPNLGEDVVVLIGTSSGGPYNRPRRASQMSQVLNFLAGPLVGHGSHHVTYSQPFYLNRCRYTTPGTLSAVSKTPIGSSPGSMTAGPSSWTLHAQVAPNGSPANVAGGWVLPPYPMPLRVTVGAGAVASNITVAYLNEEGVAKTETISAPTPGAYRTTGEVKQVTRVTSDVDPQAVLDFDVEADGPVDRFDVRWRWMTGGQVSGGYAAPIGQWSADAGRTWSRTIPLPPTGIVDLYTYAGGLVPQATGIRLTFVGSAGVGVVEPGSVRIPGSDVNGDLVATALKLGARLRAVDPGASDSPLGATLSGDDVTFSLGTGPGTRASLTFGPGGLDTVFELNQGGTFGNAVTLQTVADGAGTGSLTGTGTNALVVHYAPATTTVANVEALFAGGAAVTGGHRVQVRTPGTGATVLAAPGDTHAATNFTLGANGTPATTSRQLSDFLATSSTAGAVAARARLRLRHVGTGATVLTAFGFQAFTDSNVTWTARRPDVSLTVIEQGTSQSWRVQVGLSEVFIYLDTDANGVRTTSASQMVSRVAADPKASTYLSGVASGTGAGLAGDVLRLRLVTAFDAGDQFALDAAPPTPSSADLAEALSALQKRADVLDNISAVVLAKEGADGSDFAVLHQQLDVYADPLRRYLFGIVGAPLQGATDEDTWVTATQARFPNRGTKVSVVAGDVDTVLPAYGTESRRNFAALYAARLMICPISVDPGAFECDTVRGTKYALDGTGNHLVPGGDPTRPEYTAFHQSEDALVQLHSANMVTPRSWPKVSGVFVRQGVQYVQDGDDWTFIMARRIGDVAAALAYLETLRLINQTLLVDEQTGRLAEVVHQAIEANVRSFVGAKLLDDNGRRHITALEVVSDREVNFSETLTVVLALNIVGKEPAVVIETTVNVVRTLTVAPGASAAA